MTIKTKQRKGKVKTLGTTLKETGKMRKKITVCKRKRDPHWGERKQMAGKGQQNRTD